MAKINESTVQEGTDFLNQFAGVGTDTIGVTATATSYLSVLNDLSDGVVNGLGKPGEFFNSGTQKSLGNSVRVIPVAFKTVWDEKDAGGKTLARYEPKDPSLKVQLIPPPPGKPGYPTLINQDTGNKIIETFAYALVLPDDPEAGFVMYTAGLGSMKAIRRWNTLLKAQKLPNGEDAPIFAKIWKLTAASKISKTTNRPYNGVDSVIEEGWIDSLIFQKLISPARQQSVQFLLQAPSEADHESVEV